jgi:multiple sugar transport system substrate-binding protein
MNDAKIRSETLRIAVRKFDPFETAIRKQWSAFVDATGCALQLEVVSMDLHPLHQALFEEQGLCNGTWDVAFVVTDWLSEAQETGALMDLAPRWKLNAPENYPDGWVESLLRLQCFDQTVLGVPYHDGPECLIYRTDLFSEAGLKPPATWKEFHAIARKLTTASKNQWGSIWAAYPDGHNTVYDFCLQLWTRGGELFDTSGRLNLNQEVVYDSLEFYRTMLNDPTAIHPNSREYDSVKSGFAFARGEVAMMVNWFGFAAMSETLPESKVKGRVAIAPIPAAPQCSSASLNVYWLLGVGSGSAHASIAQDFITYCVNRDNDKLLTLEGAIGCRKSTWHDPEVNQSIPFYAKLETIHAHARELPRLRSWSKLAVVLDNLIVKVSNSNALIPLLCEEAQQQANALTHS